MPGDVNRMDTHVQRGGCGVRCLPGGRPTGDAPCPFSVILSDDLYLSWADARSIEKMILKCLKEPCFCRAGWLRFVRLGSRSITLRRFLSSLLRRRHVACRWTENPPLPLRPDTPDRMAGRSHKRAGLTGNGPTYLAPDRDARHCRIADVAYPHTYALICMPLTAAASAHSALSFAPEAYLPADSVLLLSVAVPLLARLRLPGSAHQRVSEWKAQSLVGTVLRWQTVPVGAECEMPFGDGLCGVAAIGRCSRCGRAACFSHLTDYRGLCRACQDEEHAAFIKRNTELAAPYVRAVSQATERRLGAVRALNDLGTPGLIIRRMRAGYDRRRLGRDVDHYDVYEAAWPVGECV
jgi:hypothetical protein